MRRSIRWLRVIILVAIIAGLAWLTYEVLPRVSLFETDRGGEYVEGVAGAPQSINPLFSQYNDVDRDLCALIFEGLTDFDDRGVVVPLLAQDWQVSDDGLVYTFSLRHDVTWHDGAPFTANDVVFTMGVMSDPDFLLLDSSGMFGLWSSITVEKIDDYTVRFVLAEPFAPFLDYTTAGILPAHLLSKIDVELLPDAQFNSRPVGTGPFQIESVTARRIVLSPNRSYYGDRPLLESVTFRFYADVESLFAAYEKGDINGISNVAPGWVPRVGAESTLKLYSARLSKYSIVLLNLTDDELPFFQDVEVRRALMWGLDREAIVSRVLDGQAIVANSPFMPDTWSYNTDVPVYEYNLARARELLEQAGWVDGDGDGVREKDGRRLHFSLLVSDNPTWTRVVQEMIRQWGEVGVDVVIETVSFPRLVGEFLYPRRFEAVLIAPEYAGDPDPYPFWHSTQVDQGGQNWSGFADRRADEIMEQARMATDLARRMQLYHEFQAIFANQAPAILLYYPIYNYAIDADVKGVQVAPMNDSSDRFRTITDWYIESRRFLFAGD